jgi:hypothetical protein
MGEVRIVRLLQASTLGFEVDRRETDRRVGLCVARRRRPARGPGRLNRTASARPSATVRRQSSRRPPSPSPPLDRRCSKAPEPASRCSPSQAHASISFRLHRSQSARQALPSSFEQASFRSSTLPRSGAVLLSITTRAGAVGADGDCGAEGACSAREPQDHVPKKGDENREIAADARHFGQNIPSARCRHLTTYVAATPGIAPARAGLIDRGGQATIRRALVEEGFGERAQQLPLAYLGTVHSVCLRPVEGVRARRRPLARRRCDPWK